MSYPPICQTHFLPMKLIDIAYLETKLTSPYMRGEAKSSL